MDQARTREFTVSLSSQIPSSYSQGTRQQHVNVSQSDLYTLSHNRPLSRQQQQQQQEVNSHEQNQQDLITSIQLGLLNKNVTSSFPAFQTDSYTQVHSSQQHDQGHGLSKQQDLQAVQTSQTPLEYSHRNSPLDTKFPVSTTPGTTYSQTPSAALKHIYTTTHLQHEIHNQSETERQEYIKGNYNKGSQKPIEMYYEHEIKKDSEIKLTNSDLQYLAKAETQSNIYEREVKNQSNIGGIASPSDTTVSQSSDDKPAKSQSGASNPLLHIPSDRTHVCLTCYKTFKNKPQLTQHELVHNGLRKHVCMYCDKAFKQICHLNQHTRVHTGERPYKCSIEGCGRAFAQLSNLNHHMKNHEEHVKRDISKQYRCEVCDRSYANQNSLHTHIQKLHMNLKAAEGSTSHPIAMSPQTKKRKKKSKQQTNIVSDAASLLPQDAGQQYTLHLSDSEEDGLPTHVRTKSQMSSKVDTLTTNVTSSNLFDNKNHTGQKMSLTAPMGQTHGLPFPEKLPDLQHFTQIKTEPLPARSLDHIGRDNGETQLSQTYSPDQTPPTSIKPDIMQAPDPHQTFHQSLQHRDSTHLDATTTANGSHLSNVPFLIHSSPTITSSHPIPSTLFSPLPPLSLPMSMTDSLPSHIRHHFSDVLSSSHPERGDSHSVAAPNFFHPAFSDQTDKSETNRFR